MYDLKDPPRAKGSVFLGLLPEIKKNPLELFSKLEKEFGGLVQFKIAHQRAYLINDPSLVKHILQDNRENYVLGTIYEKLKPIFGNSVSMSDGRQWHTRRRLLQPSFAHSQITQLTDSITTVILDFCNSLKEIISGKKTLEVSHQMVSLTLSVILKTMFSSKLDLTEMNNIASAITFLIGETEKRYYKIFDIPLFIPTLGNIKYRKALTKLETVVFNLIKEGRTNEDERVDLLSMLLNAKDEETQEGLNDKQLRDEIMTIYAAGHETTASTLTWIWYMLASHPKIEQKLREEWNRVLGGKVPVFSDFSHLTYTKMVIEETMRLYPSAWVFMRTALKDDLFEGIRIRSKGLIFLCPYTMHHSQRFWNEPEKFIPERFLPELRNSISKFTYYPFGGGPRICLGQQFAITEMILALSIIGQKFRFRLVEKNILKPIPKATLRPQSNVLMEITPLS